jgi:hypothetical protein
MYPPDYVDQIPIEEMSLTVAPGAKTQNNTQKENACFAFWAVPVSCDKRSFAKTGSRCT